MFYHWTAKNVGGELKPPSPTPCAVPGSPRCLLSLLREFASRKDDSLGFWNPRCGTPNSRYWLIGIQGIPDSNRERDYGFCELNSRFQCRWFRFQQANISLNPDCLKLFERDFSPETPVSPSLSSFPTSNVIWRGHEGLTFFFLPRLRGLILSSASWEA